jgi:hypothetical protein
VLDHRDPNESAYAPPEPTAAPITPHRRDQSARRRARAPTKPHASPKGYELNDLRRTSEKQRACPSPRRVHNRSEHVTAGRCRDTVYANALVSADRRRTRASASSGAATGLTLPINYSESVSLALVRCDPAVRTRQRAQPIPPSSSWYGPVGKARGNFLLNSSMSSHNRITAMTCCR